MSVGHSSLSELTHPGLGPCSTRTVLGAVALSSFSALLLEVSLTRLFSVVLFYHFAFLAISIAMLGLGAGGVFAHLVRVELAHWELRRIATISSAAMAILTVVALEIVLHVPVSLHLTGGNFLRLTILYTCSAVPFFLTGFEFSVLFAREPGRIPWLYAADLTGGALACLAVVPLLNFLGAPNAILFAALASALAALAWSPSKRLRSLSSALAAMLCAVLLVNHSGRLADVVWAKGIRRDHVEFAGWNAISRVEVDRQDDGARVIVIDADANTYVMHADPRHLDGAQAQSLFGAPAAVVNALCPHGEYAIIGPGGGVDVLRALAAGSPQVTGVEINRIIADTVMRERYADFAFHLYQRPEVRFVVSDGRSFIRNSNAFYDVVEMTLVDTWASTAAGAFALSENNLYTAEAFQEYFNHLRPDGILAVTRWEFREPREALRVVSVAARALEQAGTAEMRRHFIVVSEGPLDEDGVMVSVLAKKSGFTPQDEQVVRQYLSKYPPLQLLYAPSIKEENAFAALIASNDPYRFAHSYAYNVSPVTDNAPFFFYTLKPSRLFELGPSGPIDWKVNLGVAVLGMLLVISVLAVLVFLVLPLLIRQSATRRPASFLGYFVAIGLGYVLVEVVLIQRFVLFLGNPTYALSVVIFLLLLSSGAGSASSRRWMAERDRTWIPLLAIAVALLFYLLLLPPLLEHAVGATLPAKLALSAALLIPLGFVMGMPFPNGLRALERGRDISPAPLTVEWAWAMNAAASVLGSVLAIAIAIQFGLNTTLASAVAAYLAAWLLNGKLRPLRLA